MGDELERRLGIVTSDFNDDGWIDVFQANDTIRNSCSSITVMELFATPPSWPASATAGWQGGGRHGH